jgi:ubiquinone/menaquinone biosynthesis C-methylase UbiE
MRIALHGAFAHADRYDTITTKHLRGLDARVVADVSAAGLEPGARILDAGTGPGRLPRALAAALPQYRYDAVDLSPQMIEHARTAGAGIDVAFAVADVGRLPFEDATFDLIVSSLSQHHWADVPDAMRDLRRVLRPGGRLWIYDVRWMLRRATREARAVFGADAVRREPVRRFMARLSATAPGPSSTGSTAG